VEGGATHLDGREPTEEEWAAALAKVMEDEETGTGEQGFGVYLPMFPYLPLHEPVVIDEWRLIPFHVERPEVETDVDREVELAIEAYKPAVDGYDFGAVCVPAAHDAGPELHEELFWPLSQAVLAAMLFANPRLDEHDTWCDCRKHGTTTAENAHLTVVALGAEFIHSRSGSRITRTMTVLRSPGEPYTIPPPEALYLPDSANDLDGKLATRIYRALLRDDPAARRLDNAIAWLDFIAANGTSVVPSVRIMGLRSAFEALFGETRTAHLRTLVGDHLSPAAPKSQRSWEDQGRTRTAELSDREWWFQRFSLLRNGLTHGSGIDDDAWVHDGLAHTHIAQEALVEAIAAMADTTESERTDV
jgi:hypothetical protein